MSKRLFFTGLFSLSLLGIALNSHTFNNVRAGSLTTEKTLVLYDAALGTIPNPSLMSYTDFPPGAAPLTYSGGATVLDTTSSGRETFAGWVSTPTTTDGFPLLDTKSGFQLKFTLQLDNETHSNQSRAGFSVIILDQDAKGIELAFWEDEIWAQNDDLTGGLFTHGEGVAFAPTTGPIEYQVIIERDNYTLTANAEPILSGPLRDYSKFDGFPDPYETPNFLFLGDDATSSQARIRLSFLSITGVEPIQPADINTSTSTSSPLPISSFAPPPTGTPIPSTTPTPTGNAFELCSSGWLFFAVTFISTLLVRKIRR